MARIIKAVDIARREGIDPKTARERLRDAGLAWHVHNAPWQAPEGSQEHRDMEQVIARRPRDINQLAKRIADIATGDD